MKVECRTPEELQAYKDKALMLRMIALDEMDISPVVNISSLSKRKQQKVQALVLNKWETPYSEIKELFDKIICDDVFDTNTCVVENLPCTIIGVPELPEDYKKMLEEEEKQGVEESV